MKRLFQLLILSLLLGVTSVQAAEAVGKVGDLTGVLATQRPDGTLRILGAESPVFEGDMLITAKDSYAQLVMKDGSKLSMRPNSNLKVEHFHFDENAPQSDNFFMRLLRGGFRTVTGLIGKRGNADAYQVRTQHATIGIRGTDYTARLCASQGCQDDGASDKPASHGGKNTQVAGSVMQVQGELYATDKNGKDRKLAAGVPVYEGDILFTGMKSYAVVAFRDEGRITLQESTRFEIEKFRFDKVANEESTTLRLLKGGIRMFTGLIGRIRHDNFQLKVANSTIGIRGTGFDAWCNASCAETQGSDATEENPLNGLGVYVWQGSVELGSGCVDGICAMMQLVDLQQAAIIEQGSGQPVLLKVIPPSVTDNPMPLPNTASFNMAQVFGTDSNLEEAGLYVTVHDGHVVLLKDGRVLDIYRSETGYANESQLLLLARTPSFMDEDAPENKIIDFSSGNSALPTAGCVIGP